MFPETRDCRVCRKCGQVVIHRHIGRCEECGWEKFWELGDVMKVFRKAIEIAGRKVMGGKEGLDKGSGKETGSVA
jgi:hypothetical protein